METNYYLSTAHPQQDENIHILTHLQELSGAILNFEELCSTYVTHIKHQTYLVS